MPAKYPIVVFAPHGGTTFVVHLSSTAVSGVLPTPMPSVGSDGRLAVPWRWGGHQIDTVSQVVHFTFINQATNAAWTADVPFEVGAPAANMMQAT